MEYAVFLQKVVFPSTEERVLITSQAASLFLEFAAIPPACKAGGREKSLSAGSYGQRSHIPGSSSIYSSQVATYFGILDKHSGYS